MTVKTSNSAAIKLNCQKIYGIFTDGNFSMWRKRVYVEHIITVHFS